jgi:8-oxo-dGTP pyrophosphatase MutT (NUDIX family)
MKFRRNGSSGVAASVLVQVRDVRGVEKAQALVLKRGITAPWKPGFWNLPGGMVDPGESAKDAARRECEEEITLSPIGLTHAATWHDPEGWTLEAFVATRWKGDPVVTWESDGYAWIDADDLAHMRFVPGVKEILRAVLKDASR